MKRGVLGIVLVLTWFSIEDCNALSDTLTVSKHFQRGNFFLLAQRYDSALKYFELALPAYEQSKEWDRIAACYNKIGESQFGTSDYEAALRSANVVLKLCAEKLSPDHVQTGYAHLIVGNYYIYKTSDLEGAMKEYNLALNIFKHTFGETNVDVARAYMAIAQTNAYFIGKYSMMIEYYNKALNILLKVDKAHPFVPQVYNSLGLAYKDLRDYETAELYLNKALKVYDKTGDRNLAVANCLGNLARIFRAKGDYQKSLAYFARVLKIHQDVYHERHPFVAMVYRGMGDVYTELNQVSFAEENYLKGVRVAERVLNPKHTLVAALYNDLSELFILHGDDNKALDYAQKALIANIVDFNDPDPKHNPAINAYYCEIREFVTALANKSVVYQARFKESNNIDDAKFGFNTEILADSIIDELTRSIDAQNDIMHMRWHAVSLYERAMEFGIDLYRATGDVAYLEKAFYYSEKSKAGVLMDAITESNAKAFSNIPKDMRDFEHALKEERSKYQAALQQEKLKNEKADEAQIGKATDKLFEVNRKYDSLILEYEKQFPRYHHLKHQNKLVTVAEIQQQLDDKTAVIEYYLGKRNFCAFKITKSDFELIRLDSIQHVEKNVALLREALNPLNNKIPGNQYEKKYCDAAYALYRDIVQRLNLDKDIGRLVVIADGLLSYIPFDILLTEQVKVKGFVGFKTLPYMVNKYSISYAYSATLLNKRPPIDGAIQSGVIAFAPSYKNQLKDSILLAEVGNFRSKLTALSWNEEEVNKIGALMNGVTYAGEQALEQKFKAAADQFNIIHLAMHALIDDKTPMNSKLVFSIGRDTTEDGFLNAYELYNMDLSAQLVVLSACETGYGKYQKGEGIMSLAHGFTYAGCPSILMTHWLADDKATAELMALFYENLANGDGKDEALRKAKTAFLKGADDLRQNPAFWGSFVILGDASPLRHPSFFEANWRYLAVALVIIVTVLAMLVISRKKRKALVSA